MVLISSTSKVASLLPSLILCINASSPIFKLDTRLCFVALFKDSFNILFLLFSHLISLIFVFPLLLFSVYFCFFAIAFLAF
jgi:hypothetical protein